MTLTCNMRRTTGVENWLPMLCTCVLPALLDSGYTRPYPLGKTAESGFPDRLQTCRQERWCRNSRQVCVGIGRASGGVTSPASSGLRAEPVGTSPEEAREAAPLWLALDEHRSGQQIPETAQQLRWTCVSECYLGQHSVHRSAGNGTSFQTSGNVTCGPLPTITLFDGSRSCRGRQQSAQVF